MRKLLSLLAVLVLLAAPIGCEPGGDDTQIPAPQPPPQVEPEQEQPKLPEQTEPEKTEPEKPMEVPENP